MKKDSIRRGAAVLLSTVAASTGAVLAAQPANAWSYSSTVYVKGTAGCSNVGGIQMIDAAGDLDGQHFTWSASTNGNRYEVKFTNVRSGRVPSGGGWAWVTVSCSMGGYHQSWVEMYRPSWGDTITKDF